MKQNSFGDLQGSVLDLTWPVMDAKGKVLRPNAPPQPIPKKVGVGLRNAAVASGGTSGLSLGGPKTVVTSDGLFTWDYPVTLLTTIDNQQYWIPVVQP